MPERKNLFLCYSFSKPLRIQPAVGLGNNLFMIGVLWRTIDIQSESAFWLLPSRVHAGEARVAAFFRSIDA